MQGADGHLRSSASSSSRSSGRSASSSKWAKKLRDVSALIQLPLKGKPKTLGKNKLKALIDCCDLNLDVVLMEAEARSMASASTSSVHPLDLNE